MLAVRQCLLPSAPYAPLEYCMTGTLYTPPSSLHHNQLRQATNEYPTPPYHWVYQGIDGGRRRRNRMEISYVYTFCVMSGRNLMSAEKLQLSLLWVGKALRLERDALSMVKRLRQATSEYALPPPSVAFLGHELPHHLMHCGRCLQVYAIHPQSRLFLTLIPHPVGR